MSELQRAFEATNARMAADWGVTMEKNASLCGPANCDPSCSGNNCAPDKP